MPVLNPPRFRIPKKIIFFQIVVSLVTACALIAIGAGVMQLNELYTSSALKQTNTGVGPIMAVLLIFLFTAFFMFLILHLVRTKFPDGEISNAYNTVFITCFSLFVLVILIMLALFIFGVTETYKHYGTETTKADLIGLAVAFLLLASTTYTALFSNKLRRLIRRNHKNSIAESINNLGSDRPS